MERWFMHCPWCEIYLGFTATDEELDGELGKGTVICPECGLSHLKGNCFCFDTPKPSVPLNPEHPFAEVFEIGGQ